MNPEELKKEKRAKFEEERKRRDEDKKRLDQVFLFSRNQSLIFF